MGHFQRPTQRPTTPESSLEGGSLPVNRCSCGRESGRGCPGLGQWGHRALVDEFKAGGTSRHAREGGEGVCARGAVGWTGLPTKSGVRYFPSIQKLASEARRPNRVAYRTHPAPASRRRSASAASHTARSSHSPSAVARCRAHTGLPAFPLCRLCTGLRRSAGGGICA